MNKLLVMVCLSACLSASASPADESQPYPAQAVNDWNERLLRIAEAEDGFLTLKGLRTAAMMHIAVHDALTAIERRYAPYAHDAAAPDADPLSAAVQAASTVALDQYPDRRLDLLAARERWLARAATGPARAAGIDLGAAAARSILEARLADGWNDEAEYRWHPMAPGVYAEFSDHSGTPEGFVFGAGWARARPFALSRHDQFRSPPPPEITSDAYTRAYDEVKIMGRFESKARTADQTHLALWWKDFAENSHNRLARDLVQKERLPLVEAARLFALLNIAVYDAYVSVFDNKFHYNHWRPYTAIRWAENDGNPHTQAEPEWTNTHRHTYAFPTYPSAHGTACAAAMTTIADVFGDDYRFTVRTPEVDIAGPFSGRMAMTPPTRSFASPAEAAMECALSRVYLGIHFRYDSIEGNRLGNRIGAYLLADYLQPVRRGRR